MTARDGAVEVRDPAGRVPPFIVNGSPLDEGVLGAIERAGGYYEPEVMLFFARLDPTPKVVLDVGANIGVHSSYLARLYPDARIHSFEPGPQTGAYLQRNVARFGARVSWESCGLYDSAGSLRLSSVEGHPGGAFVSSTGVTDSLSVTVPITTLDAWSAANGVSAIDLIKLDIEGSEVRALLGGRTVLERDRPVVLAECNPVALRRFQDVEPSDLFDLLRDVYGSVGVLERDGTVSSLESLEGLHHALTARGLCELVAGHRSMTSSPSPRHRRPLGWLRRSPPLPRVSVECDLAVADAVVFTYQPACDIQVLSAPAAIPAGAAFVIDVRVRNTGRSTWAEYPDHPVRLSYRWRVGDADQRDGTGLRTNLPAPLGPGGTVQLSMTVLSPTEPGSYELVVTPVQESFAWFDDLQPSCVAAVPVEVESRSTAEA